jgi:hypothetical protein
VQIINNSNNTETVTLEGLRIPGYGRGVSTYLTNNANNLTQGYARRLPGNKASATVPGQSLLSFLIS